jgi:hypothetical protein
LIVAAFHGLDFEIEELSMPKFDRSLVAHLQSTARVIAARAATTARGRSMPPVSPALFRLS